MKSMTWNQLKERIDQEIKEKGLQDAEIDSIELDYLLLDIDINIGQNKEGKLFISCEWACEEVEGYKFV